MPEESTPPESAGTPEPSLPTGDIPAQGNDATPKSGVETKPEYDSKSFGAGIKKANEKSAGTIADLKAELSKYEDADKSAERFKAERDELTTQLSGFREREAERLATALTEAETRMSDWPDEAKALINLEAATDADGLRKQLESIGALVAKASAAPKPVPGGNTHPSNTPSIDTSALQAARKSGNITRIAAEINKLKNTHGESAARAIY